MTRYYKILLNMKSQEITKEMYNRVRADVTLLETKTKVIQLIRVKAVKFGMAVGIKRYNVEL